MGAELSSTELSTPEWRGLDRVLLLTIWRSLRRAVRGTTCTLQWSRGGAMLAGVQLLYEGEHQ